MRLVSSNIKFFKVGAFPVSSLQSIVCLRPEVRKVGKYFLLKFATLSDYYFRSYFSVPNGIRIRTPFPSIVVNVRWPRKKSIVSGVAGAVYHCPLPLLFIVLAAVQILPNHKFPNFECSIY